jgi:MFS family permease
VIDAPAPPLGDGAGRVEPRLGPSKRSLRGLDWFIFFVADVQTGFGPFVAVFLTTQKWTQIDIGFVLSASSLASLIFQMPGGALVDSVRSERFLAGLAVAAICASALLYAAFPIFPVVFSAAVLHSAASAVLGPAIAAISLGIVGHAVIGDRLGRNARFASIGNGLAAAAMGACGYLVSARAVFVVTVLLLIPALLALRRIAPAEIDPERAHGAARCDPPARDAARCDPGARGAARTKLTALLYNRPLLVFAGCLLLFHMANAAMLPLVASTVTMRSPRWATILIAVCIVVPQLLVACFSPWVGRRAQTWGRKPMLLIGFAALPIRGLLFASVTSPELLVLVQLLDGVAAAVLAVLVPLVIADVTRGTGHFNFGQGVIGTFVGIGAALSATLAGFAIDSFGGPAAFAGLAAIGLIGFAAIWLLMPETRIPPERGAVTVTGRARRH